MSWSFLQKSLSSDGQCVSGLNWVKASKELPGAPLQMSTLRATSRAGTVF